MAKVVPEIPGVFGLKIDETPLPVQYIPPQFTHSDLSKVSLNFTHQMEAERDELMKNVSKTKIIFKIILMIFIYLVVFSLAMALIVLISLKMVKSDTTGGPTDPTTAEPTEPTTVGPTNQSPSLSPIPSSSLSPSPSPPDPTTGPTGPTTGPSDPTTVPTDPCVIYQIWIGDGWCDDVTNTAECGYDGGDCCGDEVDTDYCNECICHPTDLTTAEPINPTTVGPTDPTTVDPAKSCDEGHVFYHYYDGNNYTWPGDYFDFWVGDGYCHDWTNIAECNHDGGDCCGDDVNTDFCDDCICHQ